jgi:hypothetical protein
MYITKYKSTSYSLQCGTLDLRFVVFNWTSAVPKDVSWDATACELKLNAVFFVKLIKLED